MKKQKMELINPVHDLINGNMPGLPEIIQNAMPVTLPQANFNQGSISLFFGNIKRKQLVKVKQTETELTRYSREQVQDKLAIIDSLITFSAGVADKLGAYEHNKDMRRLAVQKGYAELNILHLEAEEKKTNVKAMEAKIQQTNYQTALIAQEVELSKIETQIRTKQLKDILGEE